MAIISEEYRILLEKEKPIIKRNGNLRYISRRDQECTLLQAYLLQLNFGYKRVA